MSVTWHNRYGIPMMNNTIDGKKFQRLREMTVCRQSMFKNGVIRIWVKHKSKGVESRWVELPIDWVSTDQDHVALSSVISELATEVDEMVKVYDKLEEV